MDLVGPALAFRISNVKHRRQPAAAHWLVGADPHKPTLISALMTCCSAWMEPAPLDPAGGQRRVIYNEAWRLISQPSLLRRMDAHWRLARHYGIANALIFHKLTDLENVGDSDSAMRELTGSGPVWWCELAELSAS